MFSIESCIIIYDDAVVYFRCRRIWKHIGVLGKAKKLFSERERELGEREVVVYRDNFEIKGINGNSETDRESLVAWESSEVRIWMVVERKESLLEIGTA